MEIKLEQAVREAWGAIRDPMQRLFFEQWRQPELPGLERASAKRLTDWLEQHGFTLERAVGGVPTAFLARRIFGRGGPRIAILAEYDALPGLDNAADTRRAPVGGDAGHGCGHNHIGPANCGAAIAAANAAAAQGFSGEIAVIGCPAEEILWGKIALLRQGVFDGYDILLTSHGDYQNGALSRPCFSVVSGEFVFNGSAGHAGKAATTNALDAAELAVQMLDKIRVSRFPDIPVRHVLRRAGIMPGITPDEARLWISVRSSDFERARGAYEVASAVIGNAAETSRILLRHQFISECRGYLPNDTLGRLLFATMERIGPPKWTDEDISWMAKLSDSCSPGEDMTLDRAVAFYDTGIDYYGQDDGELSWRIPLGRVNWAYPQQVPIHHWAWTALSGHAAAVPGPLMGSEVLAIAILDLLANPATVTQAHDELRRRTEGLSIDMPRLGAWRTMTERPEDFWKGTWVE